MANNNENKRVSPKTTAFVLIAVAVIVMVAIIGSIAGYNAYKNATMTEITNLNTFIKNNPSTFVYEYPDETITVDMSKIVNLSKNATMEIVNVKIKNSSAEYDVVDNSGNLLVDVSDKVAKYVTINVNNSFKSKEYIVVLVASSDKDNTIYAENVEVKNGFIDLYSTGRDYILPTPTKTYTSTSDVTFNYDFEGWYTTENFEEESKIEVVPQGSSGLVHLFAKFKTTSYEEKDGYYYYTMGKYPQTLVGNYNTVKVLKTLTANSNKIVTYEGNEYYKFTPTNVPNVLSNGFSTSTAYYFLVEPLVWRILSSTTPTNGGQYMLFADKIIDCSMFVDTSAEDLYEMIPEKYRETVEDDTGLLTKLMKSFYDPDSLWYKSEAKSTLDGIYNNSTWLSSTEKASITKRTYSAYYTNIVAWPLSEFEITIGASRTGEDYLYCLQYSDMFKASYGFDTDPLAYDPTRQSKVTDFATANGAYVVDNIGFDKVGSYFIRGAGSTYDYTDKRFGYVKYTGAVHCYAAKNWNLQSGLRPCCKVTVTI
ncbi:MAG: hypothetical protein WCR54_08100 [Clostridia bacterium]